MSCGRDELRCPPLAIFSEADDARAMNLLHSSSWSDFGAVFASGAMLLACSAETEPASPRDSASGGSAAAPETGGTSGSGGRPGRLDLGPMESETGCPSNAQAECRSYAPPTDCSCNSEKPESAADCEELAHFSCEHVDLVFDSISQMNGAPEFANCVCDSSMPSDAEECLHPADFQCFDLEQREMCWCAANSPREPSDCDEPLRFRCQQYEPERVGCSCTGRVDEECRITSHSGPLCSSTSPRFDCACYDFGR